MWKRMIPALALLVASVGVAAAQEFDTNYVPTTPATDFSYGRTPATLPSPIHIVIEQRRDPGDRLFEALLAYGQRRHQERMLRLMLSAGTSTTETSSPPSASPLPPPPPSSAPGRSSDWRAELRRVCPSCPVR